MILFAGTLTVALYIVTDMEYPRLGLIRIERFDHFLADAYDQMVTDGHDTHAAATHAGCAQPKPVPNCGQAD
jgi:hypothetical protein